MASSGIDIYTSRREYHHRCKWWKRDESFDDLTELTHEKTPNGLFYAKEVNYQSDSKNVVDRFMFDKTDIMIKTNDVLNGVEPTDIVEFEDDIWNITEVQRKNIHKNAQFGKNTSFITYLRLSK